MVLRSYRRLSGRESSAKAAILKVAVLGLVAIILLTTFATLWWKGTSLAVRTDPASLCPTNAPPRSVTVLILDVSDHFSDAQILAIRHVVDRVRSSIPRFGLVEVYTVQRLGHGISTPVAHLCSPGDGAGLNALYQNPGLAKKRWQQFSDSLDEAFGTLMGEAASPVSPIFETIQAAALRTLNKPELDSASKQLIIISDLIQNVPEGLNMYEGLPSFVQFSRSSYFLKVRAQLPNVSVKAFYLARTEASVQGAAHIAFWEQFFAAEGATLESVQKIYGDDGELR